MIRHKPIRVLQLIASANRGGAERLVIDLLNALPGSEVESSLFLFTRPGQGPLRAEMSQISASYRQAAHFRVYDPRLFIELIDFVRSHRIELIHAHMIDAHLVGALAAALADVPLIVSTHNEVDRYLEVGQYRRLLVHIASKLSTLDFVFPSTKILEQYQLHWQLPPERVHIIPNGLQIQPFLAIPDPPLERTPLVVCNLASHTEQKDLGLLIRAAAAVLKQRDDVRFILAGEGPLRASLQHEVEELGIEREVSLPGFVSDPQRLLEQSDCFIMTSLAEGQPLALMSAMAAGRPSIVTAVGGIPDMMDHGREGFMVAPADEVAIVNALLDLLGAPERRREMGQLARVRARAEFGADVLARRHAQLYQVVLAGGSQ
jgi:glycosyltransferase involved in cell wall biosynthesis